MKFWNSDEELQSLVEAAANDVEEEKLYSIKAEYERELEYKKKLYDQTGNTDIFNPDDIDAMLYENETFRGKNISLCQVQKYNEIVEAAYSLANRHYDVVKVNSQPLPKGRTGCIGVDIKNVSSFAGEVKNALSQMILLCDSVSISSTDNRVIHISFFVRNLRIN